jgi:hypothetical protein
LAAAIIFRSAIFHAKTPSSAEAFWSRKIDSQHL